MLAFECDEAKNAGNVAKHGVSFERASQVFFDPLSITIPDLDHSAMEERSLTIGMVETFAIVLVTHADRDGIVRIISTRYATSKIRNYEST